MADALDAGPGTDPLTPNRSRGRTEDGFELTLATNHLGPFALTGLLLDRLLATPGSRIVTVSSIGHRRGTINFDDLHYEHGYRFQHAYFQSKLANLMFTYELQRRLVAAEVDTIAVAAHPGNARTEFGRDMLSPRTRSATPWFSVLVDPGLETGGRTAQDGGHVLGQDGGVAGADPGGADNDRLHDGLCPFRPRASGRPPARGSRRRCGSGVPPPSTGSRPARPPLCPGSRDHQERRQRGVRARRARGPVRAR